jgi:serine protease
MFLWLTPVAAAPQPNDPFYVNQWTFGQTTQYGMDVLRAWDFSRGKGVVVAIVDSGFIGASYYSDFGGRILPGYDFVSDLDEAGDGDGRDGDPTDPGGRCEDQDPSWHGTKVASVVAAAANNGIATAGVAPQANVQFVRAIGNCSSDPYDVPDAIRWAAGLQVAGVPDNEHPARIINVSLGASEPESCYPEAQSAINDAVSVGAIVVVAAGNENSPAGSYYYSACDNVVSVGATDRRGFRSPYSNYGSMVDISAPTNGDGAKPCKDGAIVPHFNSKEGPVKVSKNYYWCASGTSFAAPLVAGALALAASFDPSTSSADLLTLMGANVTRFGGSTVTNPCLSITECGLGIASAGKMLVAMNKRLAPALTLISARTVEVGATIGVEYAITEPNGTLPGEVAATLTSLTTEACSVDGWLLTSITADDCRIRVRTDGTARMAPKSFDFTIDQVGIDVEAEVSFSPQMKPKSTQVVIASSLADSWRLRSSSKLVCKVIRVDSLRYNVTSLKKGNCTLRADFVASGSYEDTSLKLSIQVR